MCPSSVKSTASRPTTGSYKQSTAEWKTKRASLPADAQSASSTAAKSLTLMESIVSPSPFAGSRSREGGFVLAGLTPFIRLAARQGGQVIGAGRVPSISTAGSSRAAGTRSSRLEREAGDDLEMESVAGEETIMEMERVADEETIMEMERVADEETIINDFRRLTSNEDEDSGRTKNIVSMTLTAPEAALLLEHRALLEADWEAYNLGRRGGSWAVECTQLDVQNEVWTTAGCVTTGAEDGMVTGEEVKCECEIRAMEAVFIIAQRYIQAAELTPTTGTSREAVREKLSDVGFEFLLQTVSLATTFVLGLILALFFTALSIERRLLPEVPQGPSSFSLCACSRRLKGRARKTTMLRAVRYRPEGGPGEGRLKAAADRHTELEGQGGREKRKGKAGETATKEDSPVEEGREKQEEELAVARALFASPPHAARIRKYLNPRRILAFHLAKATGNSPDPHSLVRSETETETRHGDRGESKKKNTKARPGYTRCLSRFQCSVCRLISRLLMQETTLGCEDAVQIRSALRLRASEEREAVEGYLNTKTYAENQANKQEELWSTMVIEMRGRQYELGLPFDFEEMKTRLLRALRSCQKEKGEGKVQKIKLEGDGSSSSLSSASSSESHTTPPTEGLRRSSTGEEEGEVPGEGVNEESSDILDDVEALLADITMQIEGTADPDGTAHRNLEERVAMLEQKLRMQHSDQQQNGATTPADDRTAGRGGKGEFTIDVPTSRRGSGEEEEMDRLLLDLDKEGSMPMQSDDLPFPEAELEAVMPTPVRVASEESSDVDEEGEAELKEKQTDEEAARIKDKGKAKGKTRRQSRQQVGEKVIAVLQDLAAAGLHVRVRRWRAPMAILAPTDASREGTLPLRARYCLWNFPQLCWNSMQRALLMIRISRASAISEISDQTLLTESLVFSSKLLLSLCFVLLLNLGTILVGETDERHTNRRPAEVNTAPSGFGLAGYGDLEAFASAAFIKSLLVFLSVEILFALSIEGALSSIWSPASTCGGVQPEFLLWKSRTDTQKEDQDRDGKTEESKKGKPARKGGNRDKGRANVKRKPSSVLVTSEAATERERGKRERRVSVLAEPPKGLQRLAYHDFGPGLSPTAGRAKVPRWVSARVYVRCRRQEVFAQQCLVGLSVAVFGLLMGLFLVIGFAGESFPLRHKQFVLREYLLCNLLILSFTVALPFLWGFLQGCVVWMSCRFGFCDRLINAVPSLVMFPELTRSRYVTPGKDVVKNLDGAPTADWVVPRGGALLDSRGGREGMGGES
uniref:Uncharacterized protein n=1 Tax=Chromera velia CCMP2878 TaxID=1169474 RepID=A0A0G4IG55_9ALVE|eukprot:Cvel_133.t1-p1 / transcript=Cvel_133.t1 / gene=Cvel_133 / organism=Chromera_velia_CCMP2878 / gene_product=hypothetical protein / transcript_product=hypothetical protein / location=Cvel_scaffold9:159000-166370(+) / protein_length=1266 / sequence_SO=supercontig / SO=protein_coding / is_pseudo=false